jgi:hypothetical protein
MPAARTEDDKEGRGNIPRYTVNLVRLPYIFLHLEGVTVI